MTIAGGPIASTPIAGSDLSQSSPPPPTPGLHFLQPANSTISHSIGKPFYYDLASYDLYRNTPLPLRTDSPEIARAISELRDGFNRVERRVSELATQLADRHGGGGNSPIREDVLKTLFAVRVARDEVETEQPRWPVIGLALFELKRLAQKLGDWLSETWEATKVVAETHGGPAIAAALIVDYAKPLLPDLNDLITSIEGLFKLMGISP